MVQNVDLIDKLIKIYVHNELYSEANTQRQTPFSEQT